MGIRIFNLSMALLGTLIHGILYFINISHDLSSIFYGILLLIPVYILLALGFCAIYWIFLCAYSLTLSRTKEYTKLSKFNTIVMLSWFEYFLLFMRTKIIASGLEKIPQNKRLMIVSNHRSNFDCFVISSIIKKEYICYISKVENFYIPFAGRIAKRAMNLSIPRGNLKEALKTLLKAIDYIKSDFSSICVFPEGTRSMTGEILEFKPGCFKIAEKAECPLVVLYMDGTEKIHSNRIIHKTTVHFEVLKVFTPEEVKQYNTVTLSDEIRNIMICRQSENIMSGEKNDSHSL